MLSSILPVTRTLLLLNITVYAIQVLGANALIVDLFALWHIPGLGNLEIGSGAFLP